MFNNFNALVPHKYCHRGYNIHGSNEMADEECHSIGYGGDAMLLTHPYGRRASTLIYTFTI